MRYILKKLVRCLLVYFQRRHRVQLDPSTVSLNGFNERHLPVVGTVQYFEKTPC